MSEVAGGTLRWRRWWSARTAHLASLAAGAIYILLLDRRTWFYSDEWEFLTVRGVLHPSVGLLVPHNEDWETIPILVWRALFATVGLHSYLPYLLLMLAAHLASAYLLWKLCVAFGGRPWVATGLVAVFIVLGSGWENLVWAFAVTQIASLAIGLALILRLQTRREGVPAIEWALAVLGLMVSGITVIMIAIAVLGVLLRDGVRRALAVASVPAAVYLVWLAAIGHRYVAAHQSVTLGGLARYAGDGIYWTAAHTLGRVGAVVLVVAAVVLVAGRPRFGMLRERFAMPLAMALGIPLLYVVIGVGRLQFGVDQATAPRYSYLVVALAIPPLAVLLNPGPRHVLVTRVALAAALAAVLLHTADDLRIQAESYSTRVQALKGQIFGGLVLARTGAPLVGDVPEPVSDSGLTVQQLQRLAGDGRLSVPRAVPVDAMMDARVELQVAAISSPPPAAPAGAAAVQSTANRPALPGPPDSRCVRSTRGGVSVQVPRPSDVAVISAVNGTLTVQVRQPVGPGASMPRTFSVRAGRASWFALSDVGYDTTFSAPGSLVVCP